MPICWDESLAPERERERQDQTKKSSGWSVYYAPCSPQVGNKGDRVHV